MPKSNHTFILTLSCHDTVGIVAAVSGFLAEHQGFILASAQFGDPTTKRFFMRTVFQAPSHSLGNGVFEKKFSTIARNFSMDWQLYDTASKPRLLLMVSKQGHCLNDLLHRVHCGLLPVEIAGIISNHRDMEDMTRWYRLPYHYLPVTASTRTEQESQVQNLIRKERIDLVVLARYMQILSPTLTRFLQGKAINIHHSFLPSFKGSKPYHQAYERGVKIIGATAHYVTEALDEGPIIEQEVVRVDHTHSPEQLMALGHDIERTVLARAVTYHIEQRVLMNGNKTVVFR